MLLVWIPLVVVGVLASAGLSLALGFRSGLHTQHDAVITRDGPPGLPPRVQPTDGPLRTSKLVATGYGPLAMTVFAGETGQPLNLPGIPRVEPPGTVLASPAVLAQSQDDWTGELGAWLGDRNVQELSGAALAHPREMVIVEFVDAVLPELASRFHPVRAGRGSTGEPPLDTSFVALGLLVLVLPSVALARAGAAVHLNARARRYGLLRVLGAPPRQLAIAIAADMGVPLIVGGIAGSVAHAVAMSSLDSFTLAGSSYWANDLRLPILLGLAVPLATVVVGLGSVARMVQRASRDPVATLRRERPRVSYLSYLSAAGALAGPTAIFASAKLDAGLSPWLITGGLLLSIIGLEGWSRLGVTFAGRALASRTRAQIAGSRMSRSGSDALLGVSATAVAVLLVVFMVSANFQGTPKPVGNFDVFVNLPNLTSPDSIVRSVDGIDGVTRTVAAGRIPVDINGKETSLYTLTCDDVPGSVALDATCDAGSVYLASEADAASVTVTNRYPETDASIPGIYPVGGRVRGSWVPSNGAVLIVDQLLRPLIPDHTVLLVSTDGASESLRHVMQGLQDLPDELYATTHAALVSGINIETLIANPFLLVIASTASGMAAVALLYAVVLLFRQRQAEFQMLRCLGATRRLLAIDIGLLFALPLLLAFGVSILLGLILSATYNISFDVQSPPGNASFTSILVTVLAIGSVATALVAGKASRTPPLASDPDAAAG
ncbi:MAG: hypothetical protein OXG33_13275 [Chloroflexi bacterium]|nr:hypothetical protein [Chloroflexota bacterium]